MLFSVVYKVDTVQSTSSFLSGSHYKIKKGNAFIILRRSDRPNNMNDSLMTVMIAMYHVFFKVQDKVITFTARPNDLCLQQMKDSYCTCRIFII